jgi:hypothetical protein
MALLSNNSGYAHATGAPMEAVGKDVYFKTLTFANSIDQTEFDSIVEAVQMTSTIVAIGAVTLGTSTAFNVILEGSDISNTAGAVLTDLTASDLAF